MERKDPGIVRRQGKPNDKNKKTEKFAWLHEEPGPNQPKEKDIKGTMWHGQTGKWVKHTLDKWEQHKAKEKKEREAKLRPWLDSQKQ